MNEKENLVTMSIIKKIVLSTTALSFLTLHTESSLQKNTKNIHESNTLKNNNEVLQALEKKIEYSTHFFPGFDETIPEIIKDATKKLQNNKDLFNQLIFTSDKDKFTIITHLVLEYDAGELADTLDNIHTFLKHDASTIAHLMSTQDNGFRSPLFFVVLRKNNTMLQMLLKKAVEFFGHEKKLFLRFLNGENENGAREETNYRTPFILATYNDDYDAVKLLLRTALDVLGKNSPEFQEFLYARDASGATPAFYAGTRSRQAAEELGIKFKEYNQ